MKHIVVVGASSGGIEALRELVRGLPEDFAAAVCVVLHTSPEAPGILDAILNRAGTCCRLTTPGIASVCSAGRIYVAPPDCHLLVEPGIGQSDQGAA